MLSTNTVVISTAPSNRFGAGAAHVRYLQLLAWLDVKTILVSSSVIERSEELTMLGAECVNVGQVHSDAYPGCGSVQMLAVGETVSEIAVAYHDRGWRVVLFGTYLFPFCQSIIHAAGLLSKVGIHPKVIICPAGSDVWQTGKQLPESHRSLLTHPHITALITYSNRFASEINSLVGEDLRFSIIPPPLDLNYFRQCPTPERLRLRSQMGIEDEAFVMVCCNNMRPIKNLGLTLRIAERISLSLNRRCVLILVGPMTTHLASCMEGARPIPQPGNLNRFLMGGLEVFFADLQTDVRTFNWVSDIAINTSLHDSFNLSLVEAMACGLPVVTSDVAGMCELQGVSECALSFRLEDYNVDFLHKGEPSFTRVSEASLANIVEWVRAVAEDPVVASERGNAARGVVARALHFDVVGKAWKKILGIDSSMNSSMSKK